MVDMVLSLSDRQHRGKIYAVSRRGLFPLKHQAAQPYPCFLTPENSPNSAFVTSYLSIQKLVTVTSPGDRSSTKLELSDPILNVPPEIIAIPWGQGLTVAANAVVLMNKSAIAIP